MSVPPLSFKITADLSGFNAGMSQVTTHLRGVADRVRGAFQQVTTQTQTATASATASIGTLATRLGGLAAVYAALRSVGTFSRISDEATLATARIQGLTGSTEETREATGELFEMSQRLQAGYDGAVASFARMLPAVKDMGGGVKETTRLTEILLTTAKLSGASASEAASSAQQFAQALGSGKLAGDELKSIMENNQTLARTLAAGLGVSLGELKQLGEEGKLISDQVGNALLGSYDKIKAQAASLPTTVGGAWTQVKNAFTQLVTTTEDNTGLFAQLSGVMTGLAGAVTAVAVAFGKADTKGKELGQNRGALTFGQTVGLTFAAIADIVGSAVSAIVNNLMAWGNALRSVSLLIGALAAAIGGHYDIAKSQFQQAGQAAQDMADRFTKSRDAAVDLWDAVQGNGKATGAFIKNMVGPDIKVNTEGSTTLEGGGGGGDGKGPTDKQVAKQIGEEIDEMQRWIDAERKRFAVFQDVEQTRAEMSRDRATAAIESEQRVSRFQLDTQQITIQQYLAAEMAFEERKYEIRRQTAEHALELAKAEGRDPAEVERINAQLLQLELDFQARKQQIQLDVQAAATGGTGRVAGSAFDAMKSSMGSALDSMLTRSRTFGQAMAGIWGNMRAAILNEIGRILVAKIAAFAKERLLALAGITMHAAQAGAGAAQSQASIPYVGPVLAIAAMGAIMAAVMGLGGSIKSAAGGFDIPSGLNPVTQLHAEEMVLPAEHANTIRELGRGGGGGGGAPVELRGVSAGEFFIAVRKDLVAALKNARREGAF